MEFLIASEAKSEVFMTEVAEDVCETSLALYTLFVGVPLEALRKLQLVQNSAAHMLMGANIFQHIGPSYGYWEPGSQ